MNDVNCSLLANYSNVCVRENRIISTLNTSKKTRTSEEGRSWLKTNCAFRRFFFFMGPVSIEKERAQTSLLINTQQSFI